MPSKAAQNGIVPHFGQEIASKPARNVTAYEKKQEIALKSA